MAVVFAGCTTTGTVMMHNPQTGEIVHCVEGYRSVIDGTGYRRQEDCIAEYKRHGFQRTPESAPNK